MSSEWQLHKIGLLNFWYYDEQEFEFLDGRMLLRGANGSGKSVTMQSFIPLLLDGNMRPERLDPFGSRARKMENYLLEEDDDREERIGYLYMELKRMDSESFVSIGIGMRARRNKKMDSWYFSVTDGRRIGKDFYLYKDLNNKIPYTKMELRSKIGMGGKVMETQGEYVQYINRLLFGFETIEEYQELLELLIQLRTPKLSKDFKPSVINEILSRSLQTLSEDDLRPMSEAIENMDAIKTNLDNLHDSVQAANEINRVYHQYNQAVLFEKAKQYMDSVKNCKEMELRIAGQQSQLTESQNNMENESRRYQSLQEETVVLEKERESLQGSDAARLREQEIKVEQELKESEKQAAGKQAQEQNKKEKYLDVEERCRQQEQDNEARWDEIADYLSEMEEVLSDVPFEEAAFMRQDMEKAPEEIYDFSSHIRLLSDYTSKVREGQRSLLYAKGVEEQYNRILQDIDERRAEQDKKERENRQFEEQVNQMKNDLLESFYQWERENQELHLSDEVKQKMNQKINRYIYGTDYADIKDSVRDIYYQKNQLLREKLSQIKRLTEEKQDQIQEIQEELEEWRNKKDPEPPVSEAVRKNREILQEKNIPFEQFYKVIDFEEALSEEQVSYLEEALLEMGILDALIVPEEYREQIQSLDSGVCDKYLFSDVEYVKNNLCDIFHVENAENDILKYQRVSGILSSIGIGENGHTWIHADGSYKLGVVEGTITKKYQPHYIGVMARERFRQEKIAELEEQERVLIQEQESLKEQISQLTERADVLLREWNAFPSDDKLKSAAKLLSDSTYELEQIYGQLQKLKLQLEKQKQEFDKVMLEVQEICGKCYITARLDLYDQALESLGTYKEMLMELQIEHNRYRNGLANVAGLKEKMEDIDADLDHIRYDLGKITRKVSELRGQLDSIREQLKLTDYDKIKQRLDHCVERLAVLPSEREHAIQQQTHWKEVVEKLQQQMEQQQEERVQQERRRSYLEKQFKKEYDLNYITFEMIISEKTEKCAEQIVKLFSSKYQKRRAIDIQGNLQEVYQKNRGYLIEYQLTVQTIFAEEADSEETEEFLAYTTRRIDITAKYRGSNLKFAELLEKLKTDEEEQKNLLNSKDRELFEEILANTISKKIRAKIHASKRWVQKMNLLMDSMKTSSGLKLSLNWKSRRAETEEQLDTRELVELLQKDVEIMREEEVEKLSVHFRSKIAEARKLSESGDSIQSFHAIMKEVLDYRKWFEFTLESQKTGEKKRELTDRVFFTFSGGEKAMSMYVPLFSAVVAKYAGANGDAPRLISLDEAFAGVDDTNIRDMFRLMVECKFNFMLNSQVLWGDYDTVPGLAIYQLLRPENAKFVTVIPYVWNGMERVLVNE